MSKHLTRAWFVRAVIVAITITLTWGVLLIEQQRSDIDAPTLGEPSPSTFVAQSFIPAVPDVELTESLRDAAAAEVPPEYKSDTERTQEIVVQIGKVFDAAQAGVHRTEESSTTTTAGLTEPDLTTTTSTTTTTTAPTTTTAGTGADTTTSTVEPLIQVAGATGLLFLDGDGNGLYSEDGGDVPLVDVDVTVVDGDGQIHTARTDASGTFTAEGVAAGDLVVSVVGDVPRLESFAVSTDNLTQEITVRAGEVVDIDPVGFAPSVRDPITQQEALRAAFPLLQPSTVEVLTTIATGDVMRVAQGQSSHLSVMRQAAVARADLVLQGGIKTGAELQAARENLRANGPAVLLDDVYDPIASAAAGDVVAISLQINLVPDEARTNDLRQLARATVPNEVRDYGEGETIVEAGQTVTALHLAAIDQGGLLAQTGLEVLAMLAVVAMLVGMLSFYLARFREQFWANTKRVILFGVLIVLAAAAARWIAILTPDDIPTIGYLMPAATFGFMAAILFDARIGVIMSMAVGALTAVATRDPGLSLFALLSAISPIPFVSSISARGDLRKAIVYTALALTPLAAAISWFFAGAETVPTAAFYGALNGFLSGLVGVTAVSFFEIIFDITTTLRLLDLTDRNHPALQMLEEKARGTFNHSLLVGTLGDRAARSIGANNLLVRASAYYHDLGKTTNPQYFIENQFGISNPHDHLAPEESAEAVRQHVIDGVALAKEYRIPALVADSVLAHHGDGIMRYFYHKAIEQYGEENVNVEDYRHHGHKPRTKENAILMMADALEGASRAVFADDDPTPEKIRRVVERVVGEKVADGQLSECALTLGELTLVKEAFVNALVGHYHQRIPYPNFPEHLPGPREDYPLDFAIEESGDVSGDGNGAPISSEVTNVELRP